MIAARKALRRLAMAGGWHVPAPRFMTLGQPVVLTYHGIPEAPDSRGMCRRVFEDHVLFLKRYFAFATPPSLERRINEPGRQQVLLTFDDGFRNHAARVAPILRRHNAPAIFFVPSRHAVPGRYLWFAYLKMLREHFPGNGFMFRGVFRDMSPGGRSVTVRALQEQLLALTPHPTAMYEAIDAELPRLEDFVDQRVIDDECAGMSEEQLGEIAADPLFAVGAHTSDHPLLTRCTLDEQRRQITTNMRWVERVCQHPCQTIAYPGSEYDQSILQQCRDAGMTSGYGGERGLGIDADMERPRIGVYYPSVSELGNKIRWSRVISYWRGGPRQAAPGDPHEASGVENLDLPAKGGARPMAE